MDKTYIFNGISFKYPELANYLLKVGERQRNKLYRESFLYIRLAEEYIVEILAKRYGLNMVEKSSSTDLYFYRTIYSFLEELNNKGCLTKEEKLAHDVIRRYANAALHRGVDEEYLEKIWGNCYENLFYVVSFLLETSDLDNYDDKMTIYTEGDFIARMQEEFPDKMNIDNEFMEATNIFLKRINLKTMDVEKAINVVDYYVQAIKGGTLPMLAVTYAIKISQK